MFCTGCGARLQEGSVKCPNCGKLAQPLTSAAQKPVQKPAPAVKQPGTVPPQARAGRPPVKQAAARPPETPQTPEAENGPSPETVFSPIEHGAGLDFGGGFSFLFKDEDWIKKSLIVGLASWVPVLNFFSVGYLVRLARNAGNGIDFPLPEIKFEEQWKAGAMYFLAFFAMGILGGVIQTILAFFAQLPLISVIAIPLLLLFSIAFAIYFIGATTLAVIEGNPWLIFKFPECFEAINKNLVDILLTALVFLLLSVLVPFIVTTGFAYMIGWNFIGQLGRILRSR